MLRLQLLGGIQLAAPDGRDLRPLIGRPKRFAVLAYLAAQEPGKFVRRDVLTVLFWPEMDQSGARKAVRQALYVLRTDLGEDVFEAVGDDEVRVSPERLWCDVPAFLGAIQGGRPEEALELYHGDLLPSFFVPEGAPGFEQWLEDERGRLRTLAAKAAWDLAEGAERNRKSGPATTWGRKAMALTHDDETALRRLIQLLDRMGDRAGALRAYDTFARRLKEEFGDEPSAETQAMIVRVKERDVPRSPPPPDTTVAPSLPRSGESTVPPSATTTSAQPTPAAASIATTAPRRWAPRLVIAGALLLLGAVALWRGRPASPTLLVHNSEVVSTKSMQAREHYRIGLEAYYARANLDEALAQMEAAVAADSTFAMAAYWVVRILDWSDGAQTNRYMAQALRMAPFASPAERHLIELQRALIDNDSRVQPLAELLVNQFPDDPEILVVASRVALTGGAYPRSLELARRAIQRDRVPSPPGGPCASCDGYELLTMNLAILDSLAACERIVRTWRSARPDDLRADRFMAVMLELAGRYDEARVIAQQLADRGRGQVDLLSEGVSIALRQGDISGAEAAVRLARKASPENLDDAPDWYSMAVLRHAGRLAEARGLTKSRLSLEPTGWNVFPAEVAFEAGQSAEAAAIARRYVDRPWPVPGDSTISVRMMCWWLTRASTYFASAGDTAALAVTARRLEQLGKLSAFGRDQRAYHYPLALLAEAHQQWADAEAEFRAAVLAPSDGYTRINLQLGQLLQRQGRATEAVPIFRSALHTDVMSGSTLYVTQTELHEALGQAFALINQPDSARVHYDYVVRVWAHADPPFQRRLAVAKAYLAAHPAP